MCGIAGIFAYHYAATPVDRDELRTIRDHMAARGPDGSQSWRKIPMLARENCPWARRWSYTVTSELNG